MKETEITSRIVRALNQIPVCFARKRHGGAFSSGEPDVGGVIKGRAFYLEVKRYPEGELTPLQAAMLNRIHKAGGISILGLWTPGLNKEIRVRSPIPLDTGFDWHQYGVLKSVGDWDRWYQLEIDPRACQSFLEAQARRRLEP